jgi:hypothetical protein
MLKSVFMLFPLALSLMFAQEPVLTDTWDKVETEEGQEIFLRTNEDGSVSVLSVIDLRANYNEVLPYLENPENFSKWLFEVSQSEVLGELYPQTELLYFTLEPPTTHVRYDAAVGYSTDMKEEDRYFVARIENVYDAAPDEIGFQRLRTLHGYLALRQPTDQPLKLLIQLTVDFGPEMTIAQTRAELREFVHQSADNLVNTLFIVPDAN